MFINMNIKFKKEKKKVDMLIYPIIGFLKKLSSEYDHNTKYLVLWVKLCSSKMLKT